MRRGPGRVLMRYLVLLLIFWLIILFYMFDGQRENDSFTKRASSMDGTVVETHYDLRIPTAVVVLSNDRRVDVSAFRDSGHKPAIGAKVRLWVTPTDSYGIEVGSEFPTWPAQLVVGGGGVALMVLVVVAWAVHRRARLDGESSPETELPRIH